MLFNSWEYMFCFLPVMLAAYWLALRFLSRHVATIVLLAGSLFFYGWFMPKLAVVLVVSVLVNWYLGRLVAVHRGGKPLLTVAVAANLVPLAFYKYVNFLLSAVCDALGFVGIDCSIGVLRFAVPLGISYFTFVQIAYLVDSFRGKTVDSPWNYMLSVMFWPKLVAGPIIRPHEFADRYSRICSTRAIPHRFYIAIFVFLLGLFKKVFVADPLGAVADWGWAVKDTALTSGSAWYATVAYSLQLYFDFSGYSDMAWGSAMLFGIRLPWNFNSPYKSASIQDFWRRWHISLSLWLRDYLYFSFGGSRRGLAKTLRNVFLTFLLGGIWHGAGWTFVIWGAMHGAALSVNNLWRRLQSRRLPKVIGLVLTLVFVHIAWVFFRAPDATAAVRMVMAMFGLSDIATVSYPWALKESWCDYFVMAFAVAALFSVNSNQLAGYFLRRYRSHAHQIACGLLCAALLFFSLLRMFAANIANSPFVYFQF